MKQICCPKAAFDKSTCPGSFLRVLRKAFLHVNLSVTKLLQGMWTVQEEGSYAENWCVVL